MHGVAQRIVTSLLLSALFLGAFFWMPSWFISLTLAMILLIILVVEWPQFKAWRLTPLYPVFPFLVLIGIQQCCEYWLLLLLVIVCSHDVGAYVVGRLFGRHKLIPRISPGKTWEGLVGGFVISLMISLPAMKWLMPTMSFVRAVMIVIMLNVAAVVGDLFESYLKRRVHIKDSGTLLPGHGGLLDRFDSIMIAAVALWIILYLGL